MQEDRFAVVKCWVRGPCEHSRLILMELPVSIRLEGSGTQERDPCLRESCRGHQPCFEFWNGVRSLTESMECKRKGPEQNWGRSTTTYGRGRRDGGGQRSRRRTSREWAHRSRGRKEPSVHRRGLWRVANVTAGEVRWGWKRVYWL